MKNLKRIVGIIVVIIIIVIVALPIYFNAESNTLNSETRTEAPGQFVELSQGFTHYQEAGKDTAQTILLVHGFSVPYYIWDPTFDALKQKGFHVIRFDLYGRGYSDRPDVEYNQAFYTRQIEDLLVALDIQKPIDIIGLSMGGPVVTEFTVMNPDKVNKVILIDPVHEILEVSMLNTPIIGEYAMDVLVTPSMAESQLGDFYNPDIDPDWTEKYKTQMKFKGFKNAILSTLRYYTNEDKLPVYKKLGQLNKQVMLIWGKEDQTLPFEGNQRIREVVECKFLSVEKVGHLPHYEKPEIVNPQIISFLNE